MLSILFVVLSCAAIVKPATVIPSTSFDSFDDLETFWSYLYPWGSDHNGSARMIGNSTDHDHISVDNGVLTLTATPTSGQGTSSESPFLTINYFSGTIFAKSEITITETTGYDISGEFMSPTAVGTWPAFWVTSAVGWPPEADIGEWKGTEQNWFNTFNTSSEVKSTIVSWPVDGAFHALKAEFRASSATDVSISYFLDGTLMGTHIGANFVGVPNWLIIDLQMEGSSGTPGPANGAVYQIQNVVVETVDT